MRARSAWKRIAALALLALTLFFPCVGAHAAWGDLTDYTSMEGYSAPEILSPAACVIEANTGAVLYGKNDDAPYPPASTLKILTALVAIERCDLSETVVFSYNAIHDIEDGGNNKDFKEGETMSLRSAIEVMLMVSSNEAAYAIAEHVGGTMPDFVELLNRRAVSLGAVHSHFCNPNGLNDAEQYTTARDLALILRECIRNPVFLEICSMESCCVTDTTIRTEGFAYANRDKMMLTHNAYHRDYVVCGKTGYTSIAGNTLVTYSSKDGVDLVCAVLHGKEYDEVYSDTIALCDGIFASCEMLRVSDLADGAVTAALGECDTEYGVNRILTAPWMRREDLAVEVTNLRRVSGLEFLADVSVTAPNGFSVVTEVLAVPRVITVHHIDPRPPEPVPEPEDKPEQEPEPEAEEPRGFTASVLVPYAAAAFFFAAALAFFVRSLVLKKRLRTAREQRETGKN